MVKAFAERNAVNAPIQGSAADVIKVAMVKIAEILRGENWETRMIMQVHDELVFDVPTHELEKLKPVVKKVYGGSCRNQRSISCRHVLR